MQYTDSYNLLDIGAFEVSVVLLVVFSTNSEVVELLIGMSMSFKGFFGDLDSCAVWISMLRRLAFEAASCLRLMDNYNKNYNSHY